MNNSLDYFSKYGIIVAMKRYLSDTILSDLGKKMVLHTGPRQVGKTTMAKKLTGWLSYPHEREIIPIFNIFLLVPFSAILCVLHSARVDSPRFKRHHCQWLGRSVYHSVLGLVRF